MKETFVGDTIRITLRTGIDISTYATLKMKYVKPSGVKGEWIATKDPADNTKIYYVTEESDLDESGLWALQAHVEDLDFSLTGLPVNIQVYN